MARRIPVVSNTPLPEGSAYPIPPWGTTPPQLPNGTPLPPLPWYPSGTPTSPPVDNMPPATPPTGAPQLHSRQLPHGSIVGWGQGTSTPSTPPTFPQYEPIGNNPFEPSTPQPTPLTWRSRTDLNPIGWLPPEFRRDSPDYDADYARQFRESLGNPDSEMGAQSWNLLGQYMTNNALAYMNPTDAQTSLDWLSTYGSPEFTAAYGDVNVGFGAPEGGAGFSAAMVPGARADAYYNRADRWDAIERGWGDSLNTLFGGIGDSSGWENDGNTDQLEAADNWMQQVIQAGRDYGLEGNQQNRSRWQERDYQSRMSQLAQLGSGLDENVYNLGMRLLNPSNYSAAQSPMQFRLGTYGSAPNTSSGYNANYGYRNSRYT